MGSITWIKSKIQRLLATLDRPRDVQILADGILSHTGSAGYLTELFDAIQRTRRLGVTPPFPLLFTNSVLMTQAKLEEVVRTADKQLGLLRIKDIQGQCMSLHLRLLPILEEVFCCPIFYTIGYVETANGVYLAHTEKYLAELLEIGEVAHPIDIHAWLTLPSGEIFDASLLTTIAAMTDDLPIPLGGVIAGDANVLRSRGLHYHPTIVGTDFLFKAGIAVVAPNE